MKWSVGVVSVVLSCTAAGPVPPAMATPVHRTDEVVLVIDGQRTGVNPVELIGVNTSSQPKLEVGLLRFSGDLTRPEALAQFLEQARERRASSVSMVLDVTGPCVFRPNKNRDCSATNFEVGEVESATAWVGLVDEALRLGVVPGLTWEGVLWELGDAPASGVGRYAPKAIEYAFLVKVFVEAMRAKAERLGISTEGLRFGLSGPSMPQGWALVDLLSPVGVRYYRALEELGPEALQSLERSLKTLGHLTLHDRARWLNCLAARNGSRRHATACFERGGGAPEHAQGNDWWSAVLPATAGMFHFVAPHRLPGAPSDISGAELSALRELACLSAGQTNIFLSVSGWSSNTRLTATPIEHGLGAAQRYRQLLDAQVRASSFSGSDDLKARRAEHQVLEHIHRHLQYEVLSHLLVDAEGDAAGTGQLETVVTANSGRDYYGVMVMNHRSHEVRVNVMAPGLLVSVGSETAVALRDEAEGTQKVTLAASVREGLLSLTVPAKSVAFFQARERQCHDRAMSGVTGNEQQCLL